MNIFIGRRLLIACGVLVLGAGYLWNGDVSYPVNSAYAFDTESACPERDGDSRYSYSSGQCQTVSCPDYTITITATYIPLPDLIEHSDDPPAEPDPSYTPQVGVGTGGPDPATQVYGGAEYDSIKQKIQDYCREQVGSPHIPERTPSERQVMIRVAADACLRSLETFPGCRYLLGPQTYAQVRVGIMANTPVDPARNLRELMARGGLIDDGTWTRNAYAYTAEGALTPDVPIHFQDQFFGLASPEGPWLETYCGPGMCSLAALRAFDRNWKVNRQPPRCRREDVKLSPEERAVTVCHEVGHRTQVGRHRDRLTSWIYNNAIRRECFPGLQSH